MFIKHLKHDLRFGSTMNLVLCVSVITAAIVGRIAFNFAKFPYLMSETIDMATILTVGLVIGFVAVHISQFIEKNMYGDSGYLTFTLPISRERLLISKLITAWIWFNLLLLTVVAAIAILQGTQFEGGSTVMNRDGTRTLVYYGASYMIPKISVAFIAYYINLSFVFFFAVNVMIFAFTFFNSVFGKMKVHGAVASAAGLGLIFAYAIAGVKLLQRKTAYVNVMRNGYPVSEQQVEMGLEVGRLPMLGSYLDIYLAAIALVIGILAFCATLYLLKKRVSLQ